jgi:long-chain fatty acid transport protein
MKKIISILTILIIFNCINAFAAGIYENANQSAEFIRTLTRYASTDIDSAFYNPAGAVFMKDGFYAYLSDQMIFDYQEMNDSSPALSGYSYQSKYKGKAMTWIFPDIYTIYKQDKWSAFFNAGILGRGAAATYSDSIPMINKAIIEYARGVATGAGGTLTSLQTDESLKAYAYFIGLTLGGAYKVNNIFSIGGGMRYVHAEQNTKLKYNFKSAIMFNGVLVDITSSLNNINVDVDASGNSAGFIGSFDLKPLKDMNIGFRYEYYSTMKVKNDKPNKYDGNPAFLSQFPLAKGDSSKMTLPMNASIGISYLIIPDLMVEGGFIYYFNKLADWGKDANGKDLAKQYDNGYDASISFEYAFLQQLKGSVGYSYSVSGVNSKTRNNEQLGLSSNAIGFGGTYTFSSGINFTLATMIIFFNDVTETNTRAGDSGSTKYKERAYNVAGSVSYKY